MPTKPVAELWLSRGTAEKVTLFLNACADSIQEVVSFGTHVLAWCGEDKSGRLEHDPIAPIFRHMLELLDGIGVLVRSSSGYPGFNLLRGVLEAFMSMRYILQEDSERRALAYRLLEIHRQIAIEKIATEGTPERAQFIAKMERDDFTKDTFELTVLAGAAESVGEKEAALRSERFAPIEAEFQAAKKKTGRNPAWYSLFGGPPSLEQLANRVGLSLSYELLYRHWSEAVHSTGVRSGRILSANDGTAALV